MSRTETRRARAYAIASRCQDAYSANRYANWHEVARTLLALGFTDAEAETVMRSKITRWAADFSPHPYGKTPAAAVAKCFNCTSGDQLAAEVRQRTLEDFRGWST